MQRALLHTAGGVKRHSPCAYAHHRGAVQAPSVSCALPAPAQVRSVSARLMQGHKQVLQDNHTLAHTCMCPARS